MAAFLAATALLLTYPICPISVAWYGFSATWTVSNILLWIVFVFYDFARGFGSGAFPGGKR